MDTSWRPQTNTETPDVPQQSVWKDEEVLTEIRLYEKSNSSQDQNQPEPPQIKEEEEDLPVTKEEDLPVTKEEEHFSTKEEEQLVLNQDTETSVQLQNTSRCEETLEEIPQDLNQNQEGTCLHHQHLDINFHPEIRLHGADLPQQHVCKEEEVLSDQQLWNQEMDSSLDQEEPELQQMKEDQEEPELQQMKEDQDKPELPQMKDEQEELCSSQDGEQLVLKQETDTFMMTPTDQETDFSEAEANTEQLYAHNSPLTERTNEEQSMNLDSGSTTDVEMNHLNQQSNRNCQFCFCGVSSLDHSYALQNRLGTESGENAIKCVNCGNVFRNSYSMLYHYKIERRKEKKKLYECEICGKTFPYKCNLEKHMMAHIGDRPFKCKTCGKGFIQKIPLLIHSRIHTGERPYECKVCGKAYISKYTLQNHAISHTGEKPYECKTCGKTFARNINLLEHTRIHLGVKPFKCQTCGKAFIHNNSLLQHTRVHTGEKPYEYNTCGKSFTQKDILVKHTRIHTGENRRECKTCGKTFSSSGSLQRHSKIHTGEKPFKCKTCGKAFIQKRHLQEHSRMHTNEMHHECKTCGKTFLKTAALLKHSKIHTKENVLVESVS